MEIIKLSGLKCGRGRLQEVVVLLVDSNCKVLTGKVSVFCLGGRLWEADAYERWLHMEVRPTVSIFYFNIFAFCTYFCIFFL